MNRFRNDKGFSLVETLVATFIFALVSASGVALLSGYQDGRMAIAKADARIGRLEEARSLMRADMLAAFDRPVRDALGGGLSKFEGGTYLPDGLLVRFVRNGHMGALVGGDRSALERVEYLIKDGNLVRRSYARTDITPETAFRDRVMLEDVRKVELRFEAENTWFSDWTGRMGIQALPNLAEMTLTFENGRSAHFMLMVGAGA